MNAFADDGAAKKIEFYYGAVSVDFRQTDKAIHMELTLDELNRFRLSLDAAALAMNGYNLKEAGNQRTMLSIKASGNKIPEAERVSIAVILGTN